jgi:hypothetical protein
MDIYIASRTASKPDQTAPSGLLPGRRSGSRDKEKEAQLSAQDEQTGRGTPFVVHVVGNVAPSGDAIALEIQRSEDGPVDLRLRTQDVKYLVSMLLSLGCEAKRRQSPGGADAPPTEAIPLPLDAINVGQSDDDQTFLLLEVGIAPLMFMLSPHCLQQLGQTLLVLSAKSSSAPS